MQCNIPKTKELTDLNQKRKEIFESYNALCEKERELSQVLCENHTGLKRGETYTFMELRRQKFVEVKGVLKRFEFSNYGENLGIYWFVFNKMTKGGDLHKYETIVTEFRNIKIEEKNEK